MKQGFGYTGSVVWGGYRWSGQAVAGRSERRGEMFAISIPLHREGHELEVENERRGIPRSAFDTHTGFPVKQGEEATYPKESPDATCVVERGETDDVKEETVEQCREKPDE